MAAAIPIVAAVAGPLLQKVLNPGSGNQGQPQQANITAPVTQEQVDQSYTGSQNALKQQQDLLGALQGQGGLQNQSNVYNQMQGVANGTGPNPAQAQLAQATGQNVANTAALMAGQRGASSNAGMIARQAGQTGANIQQQAAGQGATLQAQQSLNALGQMGGMANTMAGQQIGQTQAVTQANQAQNQNMMNAMAGKNAAAVSSQASVNAGNSAMNLQQQQQQANLAGNLAGGIGTAVTALSGNKTDTANPTPINNSNATAASDAAYYGSHQGELMNQQAPVQQAEGGMIKQPQAAPGVTPNPPMPSMATLMTMESQAPVQPITASKTNQVPVGGSPQYGNIVGHMMAKGGMIRMAQGGAVPALVSPGEKYLPPQAVAQVKQGADPMQVGQTVPGKPKVDGAKNSYANDTVPATLEEGGIVLPRSVTQAKHPQWAAHKFVSAVLAKQGKGLK